MECNRDEALRAKQIAESRMQIGDFVGALKFATRAQKLFPEIENIVHILTVCEVHCAAQKKLSGSEMDWYGILQIEQLADEATIKKQFRKLALLLHPDKNKFSGAEAAFKLIGEANRLLSDQEKRKLYDMKCRSFMRTVSSRPPYYHSNGSAFAQKHDVQARNHQNYSQSTGWSSYQQAAQRTFWTSCSHCKTRYEYYRTVLNATLRCQQCSRSFVARELGLQHDPPEYQWTSDQQEYPNVESMAKHSYGVDGQRNGEKGDDGNVAAGRAKVDVRTSKPASPKAREFYSSTNIGSKRNRESVPYPRESCKTENGNSVKDANVQGGGIDPSGPWAEMLSRRSSRQKKDVSYSQTPCDDDFESPSKRRRRNGSSSNIAMGKREVPASGGFCKQDHSAGSVGGLGGENGEKSNKVSDLPEEFLLQKRSKTEQSHVHRKEPSKSSVDDTNPKADHYPPSNSGTPSIPDIISCPDPDFSDFEKDRADNCFAKDQFWAIYDPSDSMPRFYALVKKVLSPGFKLRITWLEADPYDKGEIDWQNAELPVGCGKFRLGNSQEIEDRDMFSHQMHTIKGIGRGRRYMVYPGKGETWAIFKDWDIKWSSNPEKYCKYEYEYVEILSDFTENIGIEVAYLRKLEGFVCLFQQFERNGTSFFCVPPNELYRFSHRVPSFKMTGDERDCVPCGSFELDPAGLPVDLFGVGNTSDVNMGDEMSDAGVKSSDCKSSEQKVENVMSNENGHGSKANRSDDVERASSILRRSPRGLNRKDMNDGAVNRSQNVTRENGSKDLGGMDFSQPDGTDEHSHEGMHKTNDVQKASSIVRKSPRGLKSRSMENGQVNESQHMTREDGSKYAGCKHDSQPEGIAVEDQAGERVKTSKKHEKNDCGREGLNVRRSPRDLSKKKAQVDANQCITGKLSREHSDANKKMKDNWFSESFGGVCRPFTVDMFQCGQMWALYGDKDRMPDIYAQIKKIDFAPDIRLHVAFLEPCSLPKGITGMVACGTFMVKNAKTHAVDISTFCHQLKIEPREDNRYEIYPRKGEIWALYKNQRGGSTDSNQVRGDCHMVEVLEDDNESLKVAVLVRLNDSRPIYKTPRNQRSKSVMINVRRADAYRFSHRIPAIKHTGDGDTHLKGCWELDPSSVPGFVINLD
ncbi:hypothetical protein QN277_006623 [Acacia crassicarpa]|uniref:J domain-containing protein n=1 Tax=Acacia crassicarpa TaxID=499986 RepID=A0AAE1JSS3_9FABA|nr:hypothetical protein QN277_006623 [Acacia crassicarpa]